MAGFDPPTEVIGIVVVVNLLLFAIWNRLNPRAS